MFMKSSIKYVILTILWGVILLLSGCRKETADDGSGTDPVEKTDFVFTVTDLTQASFGVTISPSDGQMTYYYGLVSKADYDEYGGGELLQNANLSLFEELAAANGKTLEQLLVEELRSGEQTYETRLLTPDTDYVFYAYGISTEGVSLTEVSTYEFTSEAAEFIEDVEFVITATDVTPTSFTLNVTPNNPDVFYYCDVMPAATYEEYCGGSPEGIGAFVETYLKSEYDQSFSEYTWPYFISNVTFRGSSSDSDSFVHLLAETTYYAFAVGVANDGSVVTDATVVPVTTSETPKNEYSINNERVTDVTYSASVTAAQSETFAVMMERQYFFSDDDTDAEIISALYEAHSRDITEFCHVDNAYVSFTHLIPDEDYYLLIFACGPDGSPKLDEGDVNLVRHHVRTSEATMSDVVFNMSATNVDRTTATLNVYATSGTNSSEETFMFNYMTMSEYNDLMAQVRSEENQSGIYETADEALQAHMTAFYQAQFDAYVSEHPDNGMDMREFRSRTLESGASLVMPVSYDLTDLTSGTEYFAYLFGMKADGTFTTSAVTVDFTTVTDVQCLMSLEFAMQIYDNYPADEQVMYNVTSTAIGSSSNRGYHYTKYFIDNDEWEGKTPSELVELLQTDYSASSRFSSSTTSLKEVPWGSTWYFYAFIFDTAGTPSDVYKITYHVPAEGEGGVYGGDFVELSPVIVSNASASVTASMTMHDMSGLMSPVSDGTPKPAFEPVNLDGVDFSSALLRKYVPAAPVADIHTRL